MEVFILSKTIKTRIQNKHDIEVNWNSAGNAGFIPLRGELIIYDAEISESGLVTSLPADRSKPYQYARFKIGDGITKVNDLPFSIIGQDDLKALAYSYTTITCQNGANDIYFEATIPAKVSNVEEFGEWLMANGFDYEGDNGFPLEVGKRHDFYQGGTIGLR